MMARATSSARQPGNVLRHMRDCRDSLRERRLSYRLT
jgi:hypothetical protein